MTTIHCLRCGQDRPQLPFRPFQNEIGRRVYEGICNPCWQEWLTFQKQLINHHALDVREAAAKEFLYTNLEKFLFVHQPREN